MDSPTLADKMAKQKFSRNERVIPKKKPHPVLAQAKAIYKSRHGGRKSAR
jgi:hypothetical protein